MKLYSMALSPWARKARIALYEKGIPFEKISIQTKPDGTLDKPPEFLAANPRGKVPTLVDGDINVYESTLVFEYLEDTHPDTPLYPKDPKAKARCRQLVDIGDQDIGGPMSVLVQEVFAKPKEADRDQAAIAGAMEALPKVYDRLESALGNGPWFCGEQFTVADIALAIPMSVVNFFGAGPGDDHKQIKGWIGRINERASFKKDAEEVMTAMAAMA